MDDWGDPWQDDAAPKHPPAIDVHILADRQSKERVVTPVLTGFFEDQHKWSEPDSHDVWATAHEEPQAPVKPAAPAEPADPPAWDLPEPLPVESDKPAHAHETAPAAAQTAAVEAKTPQPAGEETSDTASDDSFHEATPTPDAHEESGAPPATPTAHEIDSSDSGTTIGPDAAGFAALDPSTPPASRPHSEEFESGISTRPSTSPSEASHGDGLSTSTRTSFEDDVGPQGLTASSEAGLDKADDATQIAEEPENKPGNEHQATTPTPNEEPAEDTPSEVPEETDDDTNEITTENDPVDQVENDPEDRIENEHENQVESEPEDRVENEPEVRVESEPEAGVEDTHEDTPEDTFEDDDFGDFEEEADEVLEDEIANNVESPVDAEPSSPNHGHALAQDLNEPVPSSPRPFVKADFTPDLSLIDKLFSTTGGKSEMQEVDDAPIKPTNARKAWYRLTRIETLHEVESGKDHDSYVRVGWQASAVRAETNQIVGRWASEDRINGRTLLGGKPGAMFGWDSPKFSPASSVFSFHSHKRNASAATTPKKAAFDLEETKQRPVSLTVPPLRKPSISTPIDVPQFSWSTAADEPNEPAASSAPPSKTTFPNSNDANNPWGASFAEKSPAREIMPISAPPAKTSFEERKTPSISRNSFEDADTWKSAEPTFDEADSWEHAKKSLESQGSWEPAKTTLEEADAWDAAKRSLEETDPFEPPKESFEEANAWKSTRKSLDQPDASLQDKASIDENDAWKPTKTSMEKPEFELPPQPPVEIPVNCKPVKNSQDQIIGWKLDHDAIKKAAAEEKAAALQTLQQASEPRPPHTRAVSDSNILHVMSPFDNPFAPPEAEKPEPTPEESAQAQSGEKKKKKRLSWLTFPKKKKNNNLLNHKRSVSTSSFLAVSNSSAVPPKSSSLPSWESPWAKTATKSPLANEVSGPDPEPEIARKEYEPEIPPRKHEPNPWDNAFDNAWDDARPSTAKSNASHRDSALTSKPELPAIDTAVRPLSPREVVTPTPKLPAIDTNPEPHKADTPVHEEKSWGSIVESPMASPAVMSPDENPWGDPWKPTSAAPVTLSVDPPSASRPTTKLAPLDTSFSPQETDDDDWGEMVESPAASSPVLAPPPSGQWGLPRSISPSSSPISKTTRAHPPSPLVPEPIRSATMPISPTTSGLASPPRVNPPKSTSNWLPKPTNQPRPLSPLNPARSSTLPVSPSLGSLPSLSPSPGLKEVSRPAPISIAPAASDPWDSVDFSVFDKPAPGASRNSSHNRTSSSPLPSPDPTSTAPTITFDGILGGATRTDRSSSTPLTFDQILQPSRERSGSARTFDDILAQPGQLSRANSQQDLKATAAGQPQTGPVSSWAEQDKEAVKKFVAALPDMSYMLR